MVLFLQEKIQKLENSICYNYASVVVVGTHCGLIGSDGATQSALQDLSIMRSMPYFKYSNLAHHWTLKKLLNMFCKSKKPTYLRIARNEIPEFLNKNYKFKIGIPK